MFAKLFSATLFATFMLTVCAHAADKETVLYNFSFGPNKIGNPWGGLLKDDAGNLYGGALDGSIFELSPNGSGGWKLTDLYDCGYVPDCSYSFGSLAMDRAGNLYGSTYLGNVIEYSPSGNGSWTATTLYSFSIPVDQGGPSPVILDAQGNLYGISANGGSHGMGNVFELSPASGGAWSLTTLHDFKGSDGAGSDLNNADGEIGGLVMDSSGNFFGVTGAGGSSKNCGGGCGVVFELSKNDSGAWQETILHSFDRKDGYNPDATLLVDAAGNLYGTTASGGSGGFGTVFETSQASGKWETHVLYSFTSRVHDGAYPNTALVMDADGNLYGTTISGGGSGECNVENDTGCGTAFELSSNGSAWSETILQDFAGGNGVFPGGLIFGADGDLYGITNGGGHGNAGNFIKLSSGSSQ